MPDPTLDHHLGLLDRYQSFSAELARLSLLGIGAIGFLVSPANDSGGKAPLLTIDDITRSAIWMTLAGFGISCAAALAHRYWSTDSMAAHTRVLHLSSKDSPDRKEIEKEKKVRKDAFDNSARCLAISSAALCVGALAAAYSLALALQ